MNIQVRRLIRQNLKELINDCVDYELPQITTKTKFKDDLGFDSLDFVELLVLVENTYSIQVPDDEAEKIETFNDAFNLLIKLVK